MDNFKKVKSNLKVVKKKCKEEKFINNKIIKIYNHCVVDNKVSWKD